MTVHPILPPVVLLLAAAVVVAARIAVVRTRTTSPWRWAGVTAAMLLVLLAAVRPVFGADEQTTPAGAADGQPNVFLVVDRSPGMAVTDSGDGRSRMAAARADLATLVERYPDARFAVISFASGQALEWPLSPDTFSLRPVLAATTPYPGEDPRLTNVAAAGNVLRYQLIAAKQQFPRAENLVYYLGAGAGGSEAPQRRFDPAEGTVDGGAVLGYGSVAGGPVPGDPTVRSSIDVDALRGVAEQLGVPFVDRGQGEDAFSAGVIDAGADEPITGSSRPVEVYWAPALLAAVLLLVELTLMLRDVRRSRARGVVA